MDWKQGVLLMAFMGIVMVLFYCMLLVILKG